MLVWGQGGLEDLPEEERACVDQLIEEIRFPLISTGFLCQGDSTFGATGQLTSRHIMQTCQTNGSCILQGLFGKNFW